MYFGDTEVEGRTFESPASLLAWLREETHAVSVFLKETTDYRVREVILADRRSSPLPGTHPRRRRSRRPCTLSPTGHRRARARSTARADTAVCDAAGYRPVVIDSDDLVAARGDDGGVCAAVELPFIPKPHGAANGPSGAARPLARGRQARLTATHGWVE